MNNRLDDIVWMEELKEVGEISYKSFKIILGIVIGILGVMIVLATVFFFLLVSWILLCT